MGLDALILGCLACRACITIVVFIVMIALTTTLHGSVYVQAKDCEGGEEGVDEESCRMIYIEQTEYSVDYATGGGGNLVDVGGGGGHVSVSAETGVQLEAHDQDYDAGGAECGEAQDQDAHVVCGDCSGSESHSVFSNSAKVSDLPIYCTIKDDGTQSGVFYTPDDKINGGLFFMPLLVWFVLRMMGTALETFSHMQEESKGSKMRGFLAWISVSIVPGTCLKPLTSMTAAASAPGIIFSMADNSNFIQVFLCLVGYGFAFVCYICLDYNGKLEGARSTCAICCMLVLVIPIIVVEVLWFLEFGTWTFGFSMNFAIPYPSISFNMNLSIFNVAAFVLFLLDCSYMPLKVLKLVKTAWS